MWVRDESSKIVIVKIFLNPLNILLCSMRFLLSSHPFTMYVGWKNESAPKIFQFSKLSQVSQRL